MAKKKKKNNKELEENTTLAEQIKDIVMIVSFCDEEIIKRNIKMLEERTSQNEAIGCMLDPHGYANKTEFFRQGIKKLEGMLLIKEAIRDLEKSKQSKATNDASMAQINSILGF